MKTYIYNYIREGLGVVSRGAINQLHTGGRLLVFLGLTGISGFLEAQTMAGKDSMYSSPGHIGFLYFGIVGVKTDQYARCLRAVNYLEPANTPKAVIIDDIMYADDGSGFDLAANDGILTAGSLTRFGDHARPLAVGEIRQLPEALFICAGSFRFKHEATRENWTVISTRAEWMPCEKMELEFYRFCKGSHSSGLLIYKGAGLAAAD